MLLDIRTKIEEMAEELKQQKNKTNKIEKLLIKDRGERSSDEENSSEDEDSTEGSSYEDAAESEDEDNDAAESEDEDNDEDEAKGDNELVE